MQDALKVTSLLALVNNNCRMKYVVTDGDEGEYFVDFTFREGSTRFDVGFAAEAFRELMRLGGEALAELDATCAPVPAGDR
jgi:hypothetical protein